MNSTPDSPTLRGPVVVLMSLAAALGTSTIYLLQPAIADVAQSLDTRLAVVGVALAGGPVGYMVGLVTLVPLIDRYPPGRVLGAQFAILALALASAAAVRDVPLLAIAISITGTCSVVGAGMSSTAGRLAPTARRATVLGTVTAGISAGILAGRIVGGWLAEQLGWRPMLLLFAGACAALAIICPIALPVVRGTTSVGYLAGLRTVPRLVARNRVLRITAARGALWFFGFCTIWAGLAVALSEPPYSYSAERIGLYALAGLSGIGATQIAGVWTDRVGARGVVLSGLALAAVAAALGAVSLDSTVITVVCLAAFDAGVFAAQVANQSIVLAIDPVAPARFNSVYMVIYFVGGSIGTAFGAVEVSWFGWTATAAVACGVIAVAAAITALVQVGPEAAACPSSAFTA